MDNTGAQIQKIRQYRGLTQKELARRAGIEEALMRRYEYGERNPKDNQVEKIARALDVDIANLRTRKESMLELLPILLYELMEDYGDIEIIQEGDCYGIFLNNSEGLRYQWNDTLRLIKQKKETLPNEEFKNWLMTATRTIILFEGIHEGLFENNKSPLDND